MASSMGLMEASFGAAGGLSDAWYVRHMHTGVEGPIFARFAGGEGGIYAASILESFVILADFGSRCFLCLSDRYSWSRLSSNSCFSN